MEDSHRLAIAATLGVVVIVLAAVSDFLFGSFWSSHAMLTSLIASLLVLAVTVVVLNEALERRDRRRWSVLAQYVLFQLVQSARATWMGTVELITGHEIETGSTDGLLVGARLALDTSSFSTATRAMLEDHERRRVLQEMFVILASHSRTVIANWAAVMVGAGPSPRSSTAMSSCRGAWTGSRRSSPTTSRPPRGPSTRASWPARRSPPSTPAPSATTGCTTSWSPRRNWHCAWTTSRARSAGSSCRSRPGRADPLVRRRGSRLQR